MPGCSSVPPCFHRVAALSDTLLQLVWKVGIRVRGQRQGQSDPFVTADLFSAEETRWGGGSPPPQAREAWPGLWPTPQDGLQRNAGVTAVAVRPVCVLQL